VPDKIYKKLLINKYSDKRSGPKMKIVDQNELFSFLKLYLIKNIISLFVISKSLNGS
jgi:hypothetical protein